MRTAIFTFAAIIGLNYLSAPALLQDKGGDDRYGPYDVVNKWPSPGLAKPGYVTGSGGGIFAETPNRIFIAYRGELKIPDRLPNNWTGYVGSAGQNAAQQLPELRNCIVIVDGNGSVIESWTQWDHLFEDGRGPHSISINPYDPEHAVWVIDDIHHQIFKFSNDGKKLLLTVGERDEPGNDGRRFKRPTDIAWLPDGTFFVTDGYGNSRIAKFDKDGKHLLSWGTFGTQPGQFNTPHAIAIDRNRRVYVSDRANNRIQVFDENGKFLDMWPDISQPYDINISEDQYLWIFSGPLDKILKYDLNGKLLYAWGTHGTAPGRFWAVHSFSSDSENNLYTAETFGGRPQKLRPKPGADPAKVFHAQKLVPKAVTRS